MECRIIPGDCGVDCGCAEGRIDGRPNRLGMHNREYIAQREALIPEADARSNGSAQRFNIEKDGGSFILEKFSTV